MSKPKIIWTENADGSWYGVENTDFRPRRWHLVQDRSVTHRTKITLATDPMFPPSRLDKPNYDAAKRYVARSMR